METIWQDVRFRARALRKSPGFTLVVLATLALGIAANTAIFSLIYGILLRPFPYADPDRLVRIESVFARTTGSVQGASQLDLDDWGRNTSSFAQMGLHITFPAILNPGEGGPSQSVQLTFVTAQMLDALGVRPIIGRHFTPEEDIVGGDVLKAMLSYGLWQDVFGGDRDVTGRVIRLRGASYTIIGVLPPGFRFPERSDIWVPLHARYAGYRADFWTKRDFRVHVAVARLRTGVTLEQAQVEMNTVGARLAGEFPTTNQDMQWRLTPLRDAEVGNLRPYLLLLLGAVVMVLLIVCVNVANLVLARGTARERELAVRAALGAGRGRLTRHLLIESLLLALAGGGLGLLLAGPSLALLLRMIPVPLPFWMRIELDGTALIFSFLVAVLTGLLFGLVPAWRAARVDLNLALKEGARGSGGARARRLRHGLVVAEIALSLLLLVGAGLMMQSFLRLQRADLGMQTGNLLTVYLSRFVTNASPEDLRKAYTDTWTRVMERLAQVPGVVKVGGSYDIPYKNRPEQRETQQVATVGQSQEEQRQSAPVMTGVVDPGFFEVLGIPFVDGRNFDDNDTPGSEPVLIVSRHAAQTLWPGRPAIGQMLLVPSAYSGNVWRRVVGVVRDTRWHAAEAGKGFEVYYSHHQYPLPAIHLLLRTTGDPASLIPQVRRVVHEVEPDIAINEIQPMEEVIADTLWQRRLWGVLLALFAGVALVLAAVGLYGVMSYLVSQRTREIGVYVALGARPLDIHRLIVGQGLRLVGLGILLGLIGSLALSRVMTSLLFGVTSHDVPTFGGVSLLLAVVSLAACFLPARRAARVAPMVALRAE
jgi:putative ABC transport system permease protein